MNELLKVVDEQSKIIMKLSAIIDELFVLLSYYVKMEDIGPLLTSIQNAANSPEVSKAREHERKENV